MMKTAILFLSLIEISPEKREIKASQVNTSAGTAGTLGTLCTDCFKPVRVLCHSLRQTEIIICHLFTSDLKDSLTKPYSWFPSVVHECGRNVPGSPLLFMNVVGMFLVPLCCS